VVMEIYSNASANPPNAVEAEEFVREKLPGATRKFIRQILKDPEFAKVRRRPGNQPNLDPGKRRRF